MKQLTSLQELRPWVSNPREIGKEEFAGLKVSLEEFGDLSGIVFNVRNQSLVCGHQRVVAIQERFGNAVRIEGNVIILPTNEKFIIRFVDWDEAKHSAANVAANSQHLSGNYTKELVPLLDTLDKNIPELFKKLNFPELKNEFKHFWEDKQKNDDAIPELTTSPKTKVGDVYELGNHKLLCGDSTVKEHVDTLLGNEKIHLLFTSPPYNMDSNLYAHYKDNRNNKDFVLFNVHVLMNWKRYLASNGFVFWNMSYNAHSGSSFLEAYYHFINHTGLVFLEDIVWDKGHGMPLTNQLTRQYEHILVLNESPEAIHFVDHIGVFGVKKIPFIKKRNRGITNYWRLDTYGSQNEHIKAAFPVELPTKAIEISTVEGDTVADCFGGNGTTLIASEKLKRRCVIMELDPLYCDMIVTRYCNFVENPIVKLNGKEIHWKN